MGLINIVGTYERQFVLSFTSCRAMMPDPAHYADCIDESFDALRPPPRHSPHDVADRRGSLAALTNPSGRAGPLVAGGSAPKEQPPRNLSGERTGRVRQRWKAVRSSGTGLADGESPATAPGETLRHR